MGILSNAIGGLTSGSASRIQGLTPLGNMSSVKALPEVGMIKRFSNLPALQQCTEKRALQFAAEAATMQAQLVNMKRMAAEQKTKMNTAKAAIGTRLDLRQHGLKTAAEIAQLAGNHRIKGLEAGYEIQQAAVQVSATEKVHALSAQVIQF